MITRKGFTLIELMIVVAIIAFLSMLSIPSLLSFLAKAKRSEAYMNLGSLAMAQRAYFADHGNYTTDLTQLGWKPSSSSNYTYGFADGAEGQNYFVGNLKTPASYLSQAGITPDGFTICAAGDIDGDGKPDILTVNQDNTIEIIEDDLK